MASLGPIGRRLVAEALGTFTLVFAGTGAIIVNDVSGGQITHFGVAAVFGLVVMAMIYSFGAVSGAHINPAVTVAFWIARSFPGRDVPRYLGAQFLGAIAASGVLHFLFPEHELLGATLPSGAASQSFVLELVMTFVLMLVILCVSVGSRETGIMAGAAIGGVVGFEALFGGPISGASMNPARSLGPALVSGHLTSLWIYLLAPTLGALLAVPLCRVIQAPGCCDEGPESCSDPGAAAPAPTPLQDSTTGS